MIDTFIAYIKNIAIFIIFCEFVQMIMPSENFKKYMSLILGFLTIYIVINPLIVAVNSFDVNTETFEFENFSAFELNTYNEGALVTNIYKNELKKTTTELLKSQVANIEEVEVFINEDYKSENYGDIVNVKIYANEKEVYTIGYVEPVSIFQESTLPKNVSSDLEEEILQKVSNTLLIDFEQIEIHMKN